MWEETAVPAQLTFPLERSWWKAELQSTPFLNRSHKRFLCTIFSFCLFCFIPSSKNYHQLRFYNLSLELQFRVCCCNYHFFTSSQTVLYLSEYGSQNFSTEIATTTLLISFFYYDYFPSFSEPKLFEVIFMRSYRMSTSLFLGQYKEFILKTK